MYIIILGYQLASYVVLFLHSYFYIAAVRQLLGCLGTYYQALRDTYTPVARQVML